ncbi:MAG: bifunctional methylenetetrahydrofolate dehydrogenase/methenyltetrahydrofolate cyclohydrolase FolD [Methyloligellaceae bacterium]
METHIIDGNVVSGRLREAIGKSVAALKAENELQPGLAVVLVGDNAASRTYVRNKAMRTSEAGMLSVEHKLDSAIKQAELLSLIDELNKDSKIHGILVQLPLPDHIDSNVVLEAVDPAKDVDGFHPINAGRLAVGQPALVPCTPLGCVILAKQVLSDLTGQEAVIIGRSNIVGKPLAQLLLAENCTVTVAHSRTRDIASVARRADLLVAAVGRPEMVSGEWIKPGATVIDVGINRVPAPEKGEGKTKLVGDVAFDSAAQVAGAITPVPGGVGPMTIACLLRNTLQAACAIHDLAMPDIGVALAND